MHTPHTCYQIATSFRCKTGIHVKACSIRSLNDNRLIPPVHRASNLSKLHYNARLKKSSLQNRQTDSLLPRERFKMMTSPPGLWNQVVWMLVGRFSKPQQTTPFVCSTHIGACVTPMLRLIGYYCKLHVYNRRASVEESLVSGATKKGPSTQLDSYR